MKELVLRWSVLVHSKECKRSEENGVNLLSTPDEKEKYVRIENERREMRTCEHTEVRGWS